MYHVLIVDDEVYEREGIRRQLDWEKYGVSQVDVAENGLAALKKFEKNPYDIVISDVKMPIMDGLSMGVQMQEIFSDVKIIFMSGYEDFSFVKQAIEMHAFDYLLKPVGDKLEQKIKELISLLNEKYALQCQQQAISAANFQHQKLLGMELMNYFINGQWNSIQHILKNLNYLKSPCIVWGCGYQEHFTEQEPMNLQQELQKYLSRFSNESLVGAWEGKILLLFTGSAALARTEVEDRFAHLKKVLCGCGAEDYQFRYRSFAVDDDLFLNMKKWWEDTVMPFLENIGYFHQKSNTVSKVLSIVNERYMEDLTIKSIADEVNYSPNYLSMIFKQECGQGFYNYLVSVRMNKAKQMLMEENEKIYQVAKRVGYEDTVAFIKRFRREFGCTPTQFRNGFFLKK